MRLIPKSAIKQKTIKVTKKQISVGRQITLSGVWRLKIKLYNKIKRKSLIEAQKKMSINTHIVKKILIKFDKRIETLVRFSITFGYILIKKINKYLKKEFIKPVYPRRIPFNLKGPI